MNDSSPVSGNAASRVLAKSNVSFLTKDGKQFSPPSSGHSGTKFDYLQLMLVFFCFVLMVGISCFVASNILYRHLVFEAEELLSTTESDIETNLREPMITLQNSAFIIEQMIAEGQSQKVILDYMTNFTNQVLKDGTMVYGFTGLYGVVQEMFLDGTGWIPPDGYVYQERPWYLAAKEGGRNIGSTDPYTSFVSTAPDGSEIVFAPNWAISYGMELYDRNEEAVGVLCIDVSLAALADYLDTVRPVRVTEDGYGILLDKNLVIIAHHDNSIEGQGIETVNDDNIRLAGILRKDKKASA
jgi:hypothetical protein